MNNAHRRCINNGCQRIQKCDGQHRCELNAEASAPCDLAPHSAQAPAEGDVAKLIATLRALGRDDVLNGLVERKVLRGDERESIEAIQSAAMKAAAALEAHQPNVQPKGAEPGWVIEAMQEALSVCDSVSMSRDRRVVREGCVLYMQTEEWCQWAEQEVAPKMRAALAAVSHAAESATPSPEPAPIPVEGPVNPGETHLRYRLRKPGESLEHYRIAMGWDKQTDAQARAPAQQAWVWNPAVTSWELVHAPGHWQQGALYAFGPAAPDPLAAPCAAVAHAAPEAWTRESRREFEVHGCERGFDLKRYPAPGDCYVSFETDKHWQTWNAAQAAVPLVIDAIQTDAYAEGRKDETEARTLSRAQELEAYRLWVSKTIYRDEKAQAPMWDAWQARAALSDVPVHGTGGKP